MTKKKSLLILHNILLAVTIYRSWGFLFHILETWGNLDKHEVANKTKNFYDIFCWQVKLLRSKLSAAGLFFLHFSHYLNTSRGGQEAQQKICKIQFGCFSPSLSEFYNFLCWIFPLSHFSQAPKWPWIYVTATGLCGSTFTIFSTIFQLKYFCKF